MKALLFLVVLAGCGPAEISGPVECTGVRPMTCTCVTSCVTTSEQVIIETSPECREFAECLTP